jgi:hypothetical protein
LANGWGGVWYAMFPPELPISLALAVEFLFAVPGSLVPTFAGVVADPPQVLLGIH